MKRNVAFESTKVGMNEHLIQYDRFRIKISLGSILQTENTALVTKSKEKLEKNDGPVDKSVKKKRYKTCVIREVDLDDELDCRGPQGCGCQRR